MFVAGIIEKTGSALGTRQWKVLQLSQECAVTAWETQASLKRFGVTAHPNLASAHVLLSATCSTKHVDTTWGAHSGLACLMSFEEEPSMSTLAFVPVFVRRVTL